jgi:hypothetical protein
MYSQQHTPTPTRTLDDDGKCMARTYPNAAATGCGRCTRRAKDGTYFCSQHGGRRTKPNNWYVNNLKRGTMRHPQEYADEEKRLKENHVFNWEQHGQVCGSNPHGAAICNGCDHHRAVLSSGIITLQEQLDWLVGVCS